MRPSLTIIIYMICTGYLSAQGILIKQSVPLQITWAESLPDSFAFAQNWSYANYDNIEIKSDGRPGYFDWGLYPELNSMVDSNGIVIPDSAVVFYQILDTSHQHHSLESETDCYEWSESNFMEAKQLGGDSVFCHSMCDAGTHSSLQLLFTQNQCYAQIYLNSIVGNVGILYFPCIGGSVSVDKKQWQTGTLKAKFKLRFKPDKYKRPTYWKGKILTPITKQTD